MSSTRRRSKPARPVARDAAWASHGRNRGLKTRTSPVQLSIRSSAGCQWDEHASRRTLPIRGSGGPATGASFRCKPPAGSPGGLAVDGAGNLFIADTGNHRSAEFLHPNRSLRWQNRYQRLLGRRGPLSRQRTGPPALLLIPGELFIAERGNNLVGQVCNGITTVLGRHFKLQRLHGIQLDQSVGDGGPATSAVLAGPAGLAVDNNGNLQTRITTVFARSSDGTITTPKATERRGSPAMGPGPDAQLGFSHWRGAGRRGKPFVLELPGARPRDSQAGQSAPLPEVKARFSGRRTRYEQRLRIRSPLRGSSGKPFIADTANTIRRSRWAVR